MALVGEPCGGGNLGQPCSSFANERDGTAQSKMHDVLVWTHANRSREHSREMERAAACDSCECGYVDRRIQVSHDILPEPRQHVLTQHASRLDLSSRRV